MTRRGRWDLPEAPGADPVASSSTSQSSFVYFISIDLFGPIKIGFATNVRERLESLQTAHPHRLVLLHSMAGSMRDERELHSIYATDHIRGEWFASSVLMLTRLVHAKALAAAGGKHADGEMVGDIDGWRERCGEMIDGLGRSAHAEDSRVLRVVLLAMDPFCSAQALAMARQALSSGTTEVDAAQIIEDALGPAEDRSPPTAHKTLLSFVNVASVGELVEFGFNERTAMSLVERRDRDGQFCFERMLLKLPFMGKKRLAALQSRFVRG